MISAARRFFLLAVCAGLWWSCEPPAAAPGGPVAEVHPPYPWPEGLPDRLSIDGQALDTVRTTLQGLPWVHAFLIVRRDTLVFEYYGPGRSFLREDDLRSATKSVVSLLVGCALADGILDSLGARWLDEVPAYRASDLDPRMNDITVRHLLTMRAGFDYEDGGRNADVVGRSADWVSAVLRLPLIFDPGTAFAYASLQAHFLAVAIGVRQGHSGMTYAATRLFEPFKITARAWDRDPKGYINGGTGLWLTPRDIARIGQLVMHQGRVDGRQIVPSEWIDSSRVPRNSVDIRWAGLGAVNYGYLWWLPREVDAEAMLAAGYGGQFMLVDPARGLIVVSTAEPPFDALSASSQENALLDIIAKCILPAVRR